MLLVVVLCLLLLLLSRTTRAIATLAAAGLLVRVRIRLGILEDKDLQEFGPDVAMEAVECLVIVACREPQPALYDGKAGIVDESPGDSPDRGGVVRSSLGGRRIIAGLGIVVLEKDFSAAAFTPIALASASPKPWLREGMRFGGIAGTVQQRLGVLFVFFFASTGSNRPFCKRFGESFFLVEIRDPAGDHSALLHGGRTANGLGREGSLLVVFVVVVVAAAAWLWWHRCHHRHQCRCRHGRPYRRVGTERRRRKY
mmetsp:Transcript_20314/g.42297  ORF Transcript_20314/g.42297 Transcript_20314/m.42297 type:complete len:255 (-) Transcript_20314:473-1237(-)